MSQVTKTEVLDNLTTSIWYSVRNSVLETAYQITPLLNKLKESGNFRARVPEGLHFEVPVSYAKQDQNLAYITRGSTVGTAEKESLTRLLFYVRYLANGVVRYYLDDKKAKGKTKILDYLQYKVDSAKSAILDKLETDLCVQSSDANSIDALPTLISTSPTSGSIGGLTRSGNSFLQNQTKDFTGLTTANSLLDEMTRMYNLCSVYQGTTQRTPDIIVTSRAVYQDYERIARAIQQIVTNKSERASLGFGDLMFKNVEMFWAPGLASGYMYFLNSSVLEFDYDPSTWMEMTEWKPIAGNSLDRTAQIVTGCNLVSACLQNMGVIYNITTVSS